MSTTKPYERGILIIATNYPLYGNFAYNLVCTIKAIEPDCMVALAHDEIAISYLSALQQSRFDILIPFAGNGFGGKLHVDLITPFNKTIFLDADMAWMPQHPPATLFANLEGNEFTAISEGSYNIDTAKSDINSKYYMWADIEEILSVHKLTTGTLYQFRSEMMYFTQSKKVKQLFARARKIHAQPRLKSIKLFGKQVPDELALNIAAAQLDIHPHKYKWTPAYWGKMHGENIPSFEELYNTYYLLSAGSHMVNDSLKRVYNRLVTAAGSKVGERYPFPLKNKSDVIKDRLKF